MKTLKKIKSEIESIETLAKEVAKPLEARLEALTLKAYEAWSKIFAKDTALQVAISKVEGADYEDFYIDDGGDALMGFTRLELNSAYKSDKLAKEALQAYIEDLGLSIDFEYDTLSVCLGGYIGINLDDGSIYHCDFGHVTWITDNRAKYDSKEEALELIDAYMDKAGVYPEIITVGRYGEVYRVKRGQNENDSNHK